MERVSRWFGSAPPLAKILMFVSVTTGAVVVHRYVYKPYARQRRYRRAEEWANTIIEQEERGEETNISYFR